MKDLTTISYETPAPIVNRFVVSVSDEVGVRMGFMEQYGDVISPRSAVVMSKSDAQELCRLVRQLVGKKKVT